MFLKEHVVRGGSMYYIGEQLTMQGDGTAPLSLSYSLAGASDRLDFALIVLAEQHKAETFVSVLAEQVLHIQTVLSFVVQVVFYRAFRTGIWDLFSCAS